MRKKTILLFIDRLLWIFIAILPLLYWIISPLGYSIGGGTALTGLTGSSISMVGLGDIMGSFGINTSNFIYGVIDDLFGSSGVLPLFDNGSPLMLYFTYFIMIELMHLLIDFIIFIPRLSHKWLNYLTRADEVD